jgi:hypothetical protein
MRQPSPDMLVRDHMCIFGGMIGVAGCVKRQNPHDHAQQKGDKEMLDTHAAMGLPRWRQNYGATSEAGYTACACKKLKLSRKFWKVVRAQGFEPWTY